jgi:hypothetical protein
VPSYDERVREIEASLQSASMGNDREISEEFQDHLKKATLERRKKRTLSRDRRARFDIQLDRHEAKYILPRSLVPKVREFIRPFCDPDPYCKGNPPEYVITTLQLDSPSFALHSSKENEALTRFKLRARIYGEPGDSPVFLEIKRKIKGTIVKSRAAIPFDRWGEHVVRDVYTMLTFKSRSEESGFLDFVRLAREIGARPAVLIRYVRESYFGKLDAYARITFDRRLEYQPTESWDSWGRGGRWIPLDSCMAQNKNLPFSAVILEVKTLSDAPHWMMDLVMHFNLERIGNCKYSSAVWLESLYREGCWPSPPYGHEMLML